MLVTVSELSHMLKCMLNRRARALFTGPDVRRLRKRVGLSSTEFAGLCGVGLSTAYRWESLPEPKINPLQRTILTALDARTKGAAWSASTFGKAIGRALAHGGTLEAIAVLVARPHSIA